MPVRSQFVEVIVNKAVEAVDRIFHYQVPDRLKENVKIGSVVAMPFGREKSEGIVVGFVDEPEVKSIKEIQAVLSPAPLFHKDLIDLACWMGDYYMCPKVSALQCMLPAGLKMANEKVSAKAVDCAYLCDAGSNLPLMKVGPKQKEIVNYLQVHHGSPVSQVLSETGAPRSSLKSLLSKGLIRVSREEIYRDPYGVKNFITSVPEVLTKEQEAAVQAMEEEYVSGKKPVLLFGVTGSGKTEVYLRLIEKMIYLGKQSIVLVPEIALTPQLVAVFKSRLGEKVAVLHSGLSLGERRDAWMHIALGQIRVVVGARSAVFAPCPNLGLIIMDEEHEQSYKQDNIPRFHTREVAKERCRMQGALFVMGSATPSVETYYQAVQGAYRLVTMEKRIANRPLPFVHIVDMRQELRQGNRSIFSRLLQDKMVQRFARKEQILLFLNRRGYHTFVSCRDCGFVLQCPHCNISLTSHGGNSRLKCHYCGYSIAVPNICPQCGSGAIRHFGTGTERVEEEVKRLLPQARIARADADTTSRKGAYDEIYFGVKKGEIDVLVGTQMIAKGLDFPQVTLVGIISADLSLHLPEMRAGERAFQLITQVAGRAGRGELPGEVVLQTYSPEDPTLISASKQDYGGYYRNEIMKRETSGYPPFGTMIRVLFSGEGLTVLAKNVEIVARYIGTELTANEEILGPAPAPLEKIKDRYRMQMVIKTNDLARTRSGLARGLEQARRDGFPHKNILIAIDVEPLNMM
ncbi:primosomal protein N' [Candidatus Formimonas warabiya]|uniref:Replication restart protein PriA n=1 Tax=Formimonas warabiya TaxID=1761012 RepID=A0A3G1KQF4_FORW1|nr:primosomal protein N' [Candidatus Formimonas warabiya]ATW24699.1 primosomal protein N' [Candidatus Formimonas warabiya]